MSLDEVKEALLPLQKYCIDKVGTDPSMFYKKLQFYVMYYKFLCNVTKYQNLQILYNYI